MYSFRDFRFNDTREISFKPLVDTLYHELSTQNQGEDNFCNTEK